MASLLGRLLEGLYQGVIDARDDIRHKVIEEGWFGKQVTDVGLAREHQERWLGKEQPDDGLTNVERLYKLHPNDTELWGETEPTKPSPFEARRQSFDELWATEDRAEGVEPPEKDRGIDI